MKDLYLCYRRTIKTFLYQEKYLSINQLLSNYIINRLLITEKLKIGISEIEHGIYVLNTCPILYHEFKFDLVKP